MKINDMIHGFIVKEASYLDEVKATLYRMEYVKNKAELIWLDRDDDNKTIAVTFKTIPSDDSGVFHILEHSVLCGSKKYPVKEPFVNLLKSSLQTFMNAFTFPDKTMYVVSSRNDQDFLNLIDVYMDGILHPLSLTNSLAFRQEGWHYEVDENNQLYINGVVYNEMKGAMASQDSLLLSNMNRLLFPDNCYGYESGGDPKYIPTLTYEQYKASHDRFYHPSNARIVLDGKVDMDSVLKRLDEFLCEYEYLDMDTSIEMQKPIQVEEQICYYGIDDEDIEDKVILAKAWVFASYDELIKSIGVSILADALCGSNEAPLKKALLEKGLAQDVELQVVDGIQQIFLMLTIRNTSMDKKDEVWKVVNEVLMDCYEQGLDKNRLNALINRYEFSTREKDFGSTPKGIVYAMDMMETWLYGGDPSQNLNHEEVFKALREYVNNHGFEALIKEVFIDGNHYANLAMLPSLTYEEDKLKQEEEKLTKLQNSLNQQELQQIIDEAEELRCFQNTPDSDEQLASLPRLSLSDLKEQFEDIPQEVEVIDGVNILHQDVDCDGIIYNEIYFKLDDIDLEDMSMINFFASLLGQLPTKDYDAISLENEISANLGMFDASLVVLANKKQTKDATPYLVVRTSCLKRNQDKMLSLIKSILNTTCFDDHLLIHQILRQYRMGMERQIAMAGDSYGEKHIAASFSAKGAVNEAIGGIDMLRWLQENDDNFDGDYLCNSFNKLVKKIFIKQRATISITGEKDQVLVKEMIQSFACGEIGDKVTYSIKPLIKQGYQIPSEISFASIGANLYGYGREYNGASCVASKLLTYSYLWQAIRVNGGAYGTRLSLRSDGDISITSYRDPDAIASLAAFKQTSNALKVFCESDEALDNYIISTLADLQPIYTPRIKGIIATIRYLNGDDKDSLKKIYREVVATTKGDLMEFASVLEKLANDGGVCVVAGKKLLADNKDQFDEIAII